jgi:hypothetical protein
MSAVYLAHSVRVMQVRSNPARVPTRTVLLHTTCSGALATATGLGGSSTVVLAGIVSMAADKVG